jgi:hypothetical protein
VGQCLWVNACEAIAFPAVASAAGKSQVFQLIRSAFGKRDNVLDFK